VRELQIEMKRGLKNGAFLEIWNQQSDVCVEGESEGHQAPLQKRKQSNGMFAAAVQDWDG
jgi:hypothetical protein